MRSPFIGAGLAAGALAWLAGVALQLQEPALEPAGAYAIAVVAGLAALASGWRWRHRAAWLAVVGCFALGWGATGLQAGLRLADALPAALEGVDLQVTGVVASLPQRGPTGLRFRFEVEHARRIDASGATVEVTVPPVLAIGWYRGWHEDAVLSEPQRTLRAGQRWRWTLRLRQPHGTLNPNGYDHELALFEQGVRATGHVRDAPAPALLAEGAGHPVERLRQRVRDAIDASVSDPRSAGVLAALAIGDQGAIEREDWSLFRDTGIAHLMSISGLHVTMFAWLAGAAIGAVWRRSPRAALACPAPLAARWGGLAAAALYTLFSGGGVPSQRTVWMLGTVTLLASLGVRWPWGLVLLAAAGVVTAVDPWALLQPGFWLSFAAVGLLMASGPALPDPPTPIDLDRAAPPTRWQRLRATLLGGLRTQVIATVGLTPLTLVFFQQASVVGFVTNLIAIPLVTLVVTPLALLGVLLVPLWTLGAWLIQLGVAGLAQLARWPAAVWTVPVAPAWAQLAGLLAALIAVLPLPWRVRGLSLPLALALLWPQPERPPDGVFEALALDVGQGSAVLVRTRGHLLVYDAGPTYSRDADAGRRVLLPALRARGERAIDTLVLSHRDTDHVGGAASLLAGLPVATLLTSLEPGHVLTRTPGPTQTRCVAGQAWRWDGVDFEVLHPQPADYGRSRKTNALSCVLRIATSQASLLLTGDIEREQEAALLLVDEGAALRSRVLLAPHHGSKTSSSDAFLAAVQPQIAIVQAGYRNRYGHPAPEVMLRYQAHGIATRTSPDCGAWSVRSDTPLAGRCERESGRRYWHRRVPD
ncbi:MAG: DNA internalization-related competence protein ComEC/Rec2 [Burkholderiaceae bacterium]